MSVNKDTIEQRGTAAEEPERRSENAGPLIPPRRTKMGVERGVKEDIVGSGYHYLQPMNALEERVPNVHIHVCNLARSTE